MAVEEHLTASRAGVAAPDPGFHESLCTALPRNDAVSTRAFDRVAVAADASHYLLTPRAVVTPKDIAEIAALFAYATSHGERLTFRSGGTSLSGQASTADILVDTRRHFRAISITDNGRTAHCGPGATVRQVNARLLRHGRRLGPDPASEIACTIGGVVANNSSGMACGTEHNSYRTLKSAITVLPSGTIVDSSLPDADARLQCAEPRLHATLLALRDTIRADPTLTDEIVRQFAIKNTMGYGLNSFVDHETAVDILTHLMVGSEGTLGFVAGATFATLPVRSHAATTIVLFETLRAATDALVDIIATSPATVELMDAASLRAAQRDPESQQALPAVDVVDHCALLIEYQAHTAAELDTAIEVAESLLARLPLIVAPVLSVDVRTRSSLWRIRKGLYATVAGTRAPGTTALLEDIAVPVPRLSATCSGLRRLFRDHGYDDAVIFGHAKDGNVHFLISEDFTVPSNMTRYRAFTEDMVDLVLAAGGSLKAEHGTGRIMAPFVARQYGAELYQIMLDIKAAVDPAGILNPDAILTVDPDVHLRHLKATPRVEAEVDRCVECGYCEPVCPSKDLTTTPRQRIVVQRAVAEADIRGDTALATELRRDRDYGVVETCAVDGMCETACPVLINTGDLVRRLRSQSAGQLEGAAWTVAGAAWGPVTRLASAALTVATAMPAPLITSPNRVLRTILGTDTVPLWSADLPRGGARRTGKSSDTADAVYFQACVGTMFGPAEGGEGVAIAFTSLAAKAGIELCRPTTIGGLCCATPWKSKGLAGGYEKMVERTIDALWEASDAGRLPVVCDNSSCSEGLVLAVKLRIESRPEMSRMRVIDVVDFVADHVLPALTITARLREIAVHPTCSSTRAGSNSNLSRLAHAIAETATVADDWGCCGFAGDRGMLHPELTASATRDEAVEVAAGQFDAFVSCNRTCEMGMTRSTGNAYQHVLEVLDSVAVRLTESPLR